MPLDFHDLNDHLTESDRLKSSPPAEAAAHNGDGADSIAIDDDGASNGAPTAPESEATPVKLTHRDLQRSALRDLVQLALESAATEAQIDQKLQASLERGKKELEKGAWAIDERLKGLEEQVRQKFQEKAGQNAAKFDAELAAAKNTDKARKQKILADFAKIDQDVKKKISHDIWLADGVLEVAHNRIGGEVRARKEQTQADRESLDAMDKQAAALMLRYSQSPQVDPSVDAAPEIPEAAAELKSEEIEADFNRNREDVERHLRKMSRMLAPRLLVGALPYVVVIVLCAAAAAIAQFTRPESSHFDLQFDGIAAGATLGGCVVLAVLLRMISSAKLKKTYVPLRRALALSRHAVDRRMALVSSIADAQIKEAKAIYDADIQASRAKTSPILEAAKQRRDAAAKALLAETTHAVDSIQQRRKAAIGDADDFLKRGLEDVHHKQEKEHHGLRDRYEAHEKSSQKKYDEGRTALERRLNEGLTKTQAPVEERNAVSAMPHDWNDPAWSAWKPSRQFASLVRFGALTVDLKHIADSVPRTGELKLALPERFEVPTLLGFPNQASVMIQTDRALRNDALRTLQMLMVHLLTSLPPGRVRFTIIDPVGLGQNFAGFMHLADYDDALVGGRILTDADQIEKRLDDLTEHMETVIQKYLRNEYATIDDYNAQAGELAEPYRFIVIADFPVGFEGEAYRRLNSIAVSGARCGVYTLIAHDTRNSLPSGVHMDDLEAHSVNIVQEGDKLVWKDEVFKQFPLILDPPPPEDKLTALLHLVGVGAKEAKRVEVAFSTIAPKPDDFWTSTSASELRVPIGRMGATRLQQLGLGRGVAQHTLIAGKTGSGKSTLLHIIITNLALWYSPEEVEFFLIDFKKGVEFKTYATLNLPHARAIAVESDREFGLSVLQRLDAELARRGDIYRRLGVQDLASFRTAAKAAGLNPIMPRTLLIIDEFQEFFSEDDKLGQEAVVLLDRLVRQGRAFGIHVLLGSQTLGGAGLPRTTQGQMAVRVALQCSEADSQMILGDNNAAARLLTRPGEAIYNDQGGLVEANSPFQIAWLPDEVREQYLSQLQGLVQTKPPRLPITAVSADTQAAIVFEGNAAAEITTNRTLAKLIKSPAWSKTAQSGDAASPATQSPTGWFGDPVAIKEPTGIAFRRQSGANVLIIGQQEESAMAMLVSSVVSLAVQQAPGKAIFYVLDGTPADSQLAGVLPGLKDIIPHEVRVIDFRVAADSINELAEELAKRQSGDADDAALGALPSIYVLVYGLQRYRVLRKAEDDFAFSMNNAGGDEPKKANTGKQFADLMREGPGLGIHILAWCDTPLAVDRTLDRNGMREFDNRILFQMSAADSSNLIDSPLANKLGFHRALAFSEEQGTLEKFRPYGLPPREWMENLRAQLKKAAD